MFNIGFTELLVISALALIFIGPKQLPEVARVVGRFLNELRRASDEAMQVFKETTVKSQDFMRKTEEDIAKSLEDKKEAKPAVNPPEEKKS
jgi:Tat protein translocase TatB subunit